jgi:cytochrome P450
MSDVTTTPPTARPRGSRQAVPGPRGLPFLGNMLDMNRDRAGFLAHLARTYGDVVHFRIANVHAYLLNHPDYIKEVLVTNHRNFVKSRGLVRTKILLGEGLLTSEGDFHLRQRRLVQPAFHRKRIAAYADVMTDHAARASERWATLEPDAAVDMSHEMMRLTLAIVGKTLFDADVENEADEIGQAMDTAMAYFPRLMLPFSEAIERMPIPAMRRLQDSLDRLNATVYRIINERRASGEDRGDLLSMLLLAQDEEGDTGGMTDKQVRDEAMTLFLAGHETTANAMTWTWYLLSQHPEVEAKLHAELDAVLNGHLPTMEDLERLPYTRMVLSESMRLYPPAWVVARRTLNDFEIGGYYIPANSVVFMSQYVMHRDPRYYDEPDRFDPERWASESQTERPKFAYFPFGGGPRLCIGESFAWMEGTLLLAALAQTWRARLVPGQAVELLPLITLRPKDGISMTLERRTA